MQGSVIESFVAGLFVDFFLLMIQNQYMFSGMFFLKLLSCTRFYGASVKLIFISNIYVTSLTSEIFERPTIWSISCHSSHRKIIKSVIFIIYRPVIQNLNCRLDRGRRQSCLRDLIMNLWEQKGKINEDISILVITTECCWWEIIDLLV